MKGQPARGGQALSLSASGVCAQLKATAARKALPVQFHGARDHLDSSMHDYQVINRVQIERSDGSN